MSSWRGGTNNTASENGPRAKCDQVIFEAMAKAAEVVVGSRCWIDGGAAMSQPSGSSRFNLLVPEIQGVRSILQRWKRALHVPLRLDVYFQHPDQRRELLERWCLEYVPSQFQQQLDTLSSDPIVQLRFVCKKIVIWLRTLYCMCRMLPSQTLRGSTIGFSIYVVSEGNEDVSVLVTNQGFLSQRQPSSVTTPYGELGWKVFYANKDTVDRLLPDKSPYKTQNRPIPNRTMRIAVPKSPTPSTASKHEPSPRVVQSAPQHNGHPYHRANSTSNAHQSPRTIAPPHRSNSLADDNIAKSLATNHKLGDGLVKTKSQHGSGKHKSTLSAIPQKTLSGLSLAMMMSDENIDTDDEVGGRSSKPSAEQAEKRRAALHHAPPQLLTSNTVDSGSPSLAQHKSLAGAGEYGYAYNSQIPWQQGKKVNGTTTTSGTSNHSRHRVSITDQTVDRTGSPSSLPVGTPPTGVLGATPPGGGFLGTATPPMVRPSTLIPPRSGGSVAPPFVRPIGFVTDPANTQTVTATATSVSAPATAKAQGQNAQEQPTSTAASNGTNAQTRSPVTSLDLLHMSPFHQAPGGSLVSSLSVHDHSNFNSILSSQVDAAFHPFEDHYRPNNANDDDMPFAIDDSTSPLDLGATGSSGLASSSAVASFAQRCTTASRLSMFDSTSKQNEANNANADMVSSLADQLDEFKLFGASLSPFEKNDKAETAGGGGSSSSNNNGTSAAAIPLRS